MANRLDLSGGSDPLGILVCGRIRQRSIFAEIASILADIASTSAGVVSISTDMAEGVCAVRCICVLATIALDGES